MSRENAPIRASGLTFPSWFLWIALGALGCGSKTLAGAGGTGGGSGGSATVTGGAGSTGDGGSGVAGSGGATGGVGGGGVGGGRGGVGGGGVAGGSGSGGGGGGAICPPPLSMFGCAATYDEQLTVTFCSSSGRISAGRCGSGWSWRCSSLYVQECIYDSDKNLIAAQHCDDAPSMFRGCAETWGFFCIESSGYGSDGGPGCNPYDLPDAGPDAASAL